MLRKRSHVMITFHNEVEAVNPGSTQRRHDSIRQEASVASLATGSEWVAW